MAISRSEFLRLSALVAGSAVLASCTPVYRELARTAGAGSLGLTLPPAEAGWLRRLTYGPAAWDQVLVGSRGLDAWIEEQLDPSGIDDEAAGLRLRTLDFIGLDADALLGWKKANLAKDFKRAALIRKVYSRRQLYEQMVEFWTDHFNIALAKGDCWFLKVIDDERVIRKHALGNFRDLLWASAHSPAMLVYLDNQVNLKDAPNENYARELMELHSLGVGGGYSQRDVMELARCLTGWTVKSHFWRGEFTFDPGTHDDGEKDVLGLHLEPAGIAETERVLDLLVEHPSTARMISRKLVRRFITDRPDEEAPEVVERGAEAFLKSKGDILTVLNQILQSGTRVETRMIGQKYKRPLDFVCSALRSLNAESDGGGTLHRHLAGMGQPLYEWPTPDGPPDLAESWRSLLPRWKYSLELARGEIKGSSLPFEDLTSGAISPADITWQIGGRLGLALPDHTVRSLERALDTNSLESTGDLASLITAGLIASPAFQWR